MKLATSNSLLFLEIYLILLIFWRLKMIGFLWHSSSKYVINSVIRQNSILILFFSTWLVSIIMFCVRLLSELMILLSTHHVTNHLSYISELIPEILELIQFFIQLYIDIWKINLYLQANPYRLKTKNINSLIFVSTIIK